MVFHYLLNSFSPFFSFKGEIIRTEFSRNGSLLAMLQNNGILFFLSMETRSIVHKIKPKEDNKRLFLKEIVWADSMEEVICFSLSGEILFCSFKEKKSHLFQTAERILDIKSFEDHWILISTIYEERRFKIFIDHSKKYYMFEWIGKPVSISKNKTIGFCDQKDLFVVGFYKQKEYLFLFSKRYFSLSVVSTKDHTQKVLIESLPKEIKHVSFYKKDSVLAITSVSGEVYLCGLENKQEKWMAVFPQIQNINENILYIEKENEYDYPESIERKEEIKEEEEIVLSTKKEYSFFQFPIYSKKTYLKYNNFQLNTN